MSFNFNPRVSDADKQKLLQAVGDTLYRDNLARSMPAFKDFTLTAAQMGSLNATPVSLVAAPGAGYVNIVERVVFYLDAGATPFELSSGVLDVKYTDGSGVVAAEATNAFVESATDAVFSAYGRDVVAVVNAALVAHVSSDVSAGDGVIYGRIFYRTEKIADYA